MSAFRVVFMLILTLWVAQCFIVGRASGQPLGPSSSPDPAAVMPEPIHNDAFFDWPERVDLYAPGGVIRSREVKITALPSSLIPHEAYQMMVRSNDAKDRPVPVTSTLVVPATPWTLPGARPVIAYNVPINSLGMMCTPSYRMVHDIQAIDLDAPPLLPLFLAKGYAVLLTDHEGPRMAYASGRMAAHAVLDSIRGLKQLDSVDLAQSPIMLSGYSGGAIATGWAVQMQPSYAPDVDLAGAVAGGTPADFGLLRRTMSGTLGSGLYLASVLGLAREYPEMLDLASPLGLALATSPLKDQCVIGLAAVGVAMLPAEIFANTPDPFNTLVARTVVADNRMGSLTPEAPVLLYQGSSRVFLGDEWIPEQGVLTLQNEWCSHGANVAYAPQFGEHITAAVLGLPEVLHWIDERFSGVTAPQGCP